MSDRFEDNNLNATRRRKCFYDFSKDYPGTRYDKNKRSSLTDELDGKRIIIKRVLAVLAVIFCFLLTYFVVYTVIGISHESVDGLDEIGVSSAAETYTVADEDIVDMIRERSATSSQVQQTTDQSQTAYDSDNIQ